MKRLILFACLICLSSHSQTMQIGGSTSIQGVAALQLTAAIPTNSNPGQLQWVRNQIGSYRLLPLAIAIDHSNNAIVGGNYADAAGSQSDLGGGLLPYAPGFTGFLVKYSQQNVFVWQKSLASSFTGVAIDSSDNVIVTGSFLGTVNFGGTSLTSTTNIIGQPTADIFVAKYSSAGTLSWVKGFGGDNSDGGTSIAVDGSDNVIFAAQFNSASINFGTGAIASHGDSDIAIVKLSGSNGSTTWANGYGSTGYDIPNGVAVDSSGNAVFTGKYGGTIDLGGGTIGTASGGIAVGKYASANGAYSWAKALNGVAGYGVAVEQSSGNVFVTGQSNRISIISYNSSGTELWAKSFGAGTDIGRSVCVDGSSNLSFTGNVSGLVDFAGTGQMLVGGSFYVANFTTAGVYRWAIRPSPNGGVGTGIAYDSGGCVLITGNFFNTANFGGQQISAPSGVTDGFVVKYIK